MHFSRAECKQSKLLGGRGGGRDRRFLLIEMLSRDDATPKTMQERLRNVVSTPIDGHFQAIFTLSTIDTEMAIRQWPI